MTEPLKKQIQRRKFVDFVFLGIGSVLLVSTLAILLALLIHLAMDGSSRLSLEFFTSFPSRFPERAGILSAWVGSLAIISVTSFVAIPLGVAAGLYLEEYARKNWVTTLIEINISNLAGVPSIVFGLMALGFFVRILNLGQSILTGGLTLALLILPIVIVATREAIRSVPRHIREAAYALGATRWQMITHHLLPYSLGGVATGVIIGLSRALGETAPLLTIGALTFIAFLPSPPIVMEPPWISFQWLLDPFTVLPVQIFNWVSRPQPEFHFNAAAAALVLVAMTLSLNLLAIIVRMRFRKRIKW